MNEAGQYFNVWTTDELAEIVEVMKNNPALTIRSNECRGIDENHVEYYWFMEIVFKRLRELFGNDIEPVFGMYLNETKPWGIHTDAYHCANSPDRESALSILMPLSLDNDVANLDKGFTIIFEQPVQSTQDTQFENILKLPDLSNEPNSALNIYEEHLGHNSIDVVKRVTVKAVLPWTLGSVLYWDSLLLHDSNDFLRYGLKSKQAIVVHTYKKKK